MSGIVGMWNLDGEPIDRALLGRMTASLAFRGPDAQATWTSGPVGFGHTLLRTTAEAERERQPCSLDGEVWITADARIDGRAELIDKLAGHGREDLRDAPDAELILHAYHVWGEDCVKHLLGDFAFAVWDGRGRRLFCARDHFGVKPFYYARVANSVVFSNTLNSVRLHPDVSDELNDLAIADFLLFDYNQDEATTAFADIKRLPPAHALTWTVEGGPRLRRYWAPPTDGRIRYRREGDYVEHFKELWLSAVGDRLRTDRIAVFMSGGLDSPAIAATARGLLAKRGSSFDLRAFTVVYDRLIPDRERYYSGMAAEGLGIPIHYLPADDYKLYERLDEPELCTPEPTPEVLTAVRADLHRAAAEHSRVALTGYGGDPLLSSTLLVDLVTRMPWGRLLANAVRFVGSRRRLPPLGLRSRVKRWLGKPDWRPPYPSWLNKDLERRLGLHARWEEVTRPLESVHPLRPKAHASMTWPFWAYRFETCDPGVTRVTVEVRHPFFDVRLVNYLLALPPLPWFAEKEILRVAMRGALPEPIRLRPKAALAGEPVFELVRQAGDTLAGQFDAVPELARYVEALPSPQGIGNGNGDSSQVWMNLRPITLNYWLRQQESLDNTPHEQEGLDHGFSQHPTREEDLPEPSAADLR